MPVVEGPGGWERVDERKAKFRGMGNVETPFGGFELEPEDLKTHVGLSSSMILV